MAALNGCTSICHAANVFVNVEEPNIPLDLIFNMDRQTTYVNLDKGGKLLRFLPGFIEEARGNGHGATRQKEKNEEGDQPRTVAIDHLSNAAGNYEGILSYIQSFVF